MLSIQQLVETVEELLSEHERLLQLAERKKQALIKGDMEALQAVVNEEVQFIRKVEILEERRQEQGRQIAVQYGIRLEELTASKLAALEPEPQRAAKIKLLTGRFAKVIGEIKAANELNGQLIRQSLDLVQRSIDLLVDVSDAGVYTDKGNVGQTVGQKRFFDKQA
ncbi:flagellar protein FlgN [Effusibacillus pohliae]|uniref:flagellar protein FlgN n=1 Tax=Effusibacillus pohliae TaxID=232270 RepID=UPI00037F71B9|nr:flagellar protein FlgN [Effusibacillus pohliae]